jgi:hypothetical protein
MEQFCVLILVVGTWICTCDSINTHTLTHTQDYMCDWWNLNTVHGLHQNLQPWNFETVLQLWKMLTVREGRAHKTSLYALLIFLWLIILNNSTKWITSGFRQSSATLEGSPWQSEERENRLYQHYQQQLACRLWLIFKKKSSVVLCTYRISVSQSLSLSPLPNSPSLSPLFWLLSHKVLLLNGKPFLFIFTPPVLAWKRKKNKNKSIDNANWDW